MLATLQAFALAIFFLGIRPQASLAFRYNQPRQGTLVTPAEYVESISISQTTKGLDGQQAQSGLATKIFDAVQIDHGLPLSLSHDQFSHRSAISGSSLIRSPPIGSPA